MSEYAPRTSLEKRLSPINQLIANGFIDPEGNLTKRARRILHSLLIDDPDLAHDAPPPDTSISGGALLHEQLDNDTLTINGNPATVRAVADILNTYKSFTPPDKSKLGWQRNLLGVGLGGVFAVGVNAGLAQGDVFSSTVAGVIGGITGGVGSIASDSLLRERDKHWFWGNIDILAEAEESDPEYMTRVGRTPLLPDYPYNDDNIVRTLWEHRCTESAQHGRCNHVDKVIDEGLLTIGSYTISQAERRERFQNELGIPPNANAADLLKDLLAKNNDGYNTPFILEILQARQHALDQIQTLQNEVMAAQARREADVSLPTDAQLISNPESLTKRREEYRNWAMYRAFIAHVDEELEDARNKGQHWRRIAAIAWRTAAITGRKIELREQGSARITRVATPIEAIDEEYTAAWKRVLHLTTSTADNDPAAHLRNALDNLINDPDLYANADSRVRAIHDGIFSAGIIVLNRGGTDEEVAQAAEAVWHAGRILPDLSTKLTTKSVTPDQVYQQLYEKYVQVIPLPSPDSLD